MTSGKDRHNRYFLTSVTRTSDFENGEFEVQGLERSEWSHGDFVAARVVGKPSSLYNIEIPNGRKAEMMIGDEVIGAFGTRAATLEGVGDWQAIGEDGRFHALTGAGLFGKLTSASHLIPRLMELEYCGHVFSGGVRKRMSDYIEPVAAIPFTAPVILVVGTSMSAGKTTSGRIIVHELMRQGLRVAGVKFTGAARFRDTLSFRDAGAVAVLDFVDAGLPSTIVSESRFREAMKYMLSRLAAERPHIVVAEAGASPMEPYNGATCIEMLGDHIAFVVLSAFDPYSVSGVQKAFGLEPDVVTGPTTNTTAGVELARKLTGIPALNLIDPGSGPELRKLLSQALRPWGIELAPDPA